MIAPCLWFDGNAEEAARFYVSAFPDSHLDIVSHYGEGMPFPAGTVPEALGRMMKQGRSEQLARMMGALMKMSKLEVATPEAAYRGDDTG
ncbi:MAG TPA: VOC family protein [Rhodopila sp.]|jgi:predicted 3-demethylubiquinone-9 3-methyltransferase (glyoxalase superfamily)